MLDNIPRVADITEEECSSSALELPPLLFDILNNNSVAALFQPIIDFNKQSIFGYESSPYESCRTAA